MMKAMMMMAAVFAATVAGADTWPSSAVYSKPEKIGPHLYSIKFESYDYGYANDYHTRLERAMGEAEKKAGGGCTACRRGNFVGRNFDWLYDDSDEFLVRVDAIPGARHASIGIMTPASVTPVQPLPNGSGDGKIYEMIPFFTMDGINDAGVFCECNLMPWMDELKDRGTKLGDPLARPICQGAVTRFILDYAGSARQAVELLKKVSIRSFEYSPVAWMVADAKDTFVLEVIDNELHVIEGEKACTLTNFYLSKSPVAGKPYSKYAGGTERYERLAKAGHDITTAEAMLALMKTEFYTQMYIPGKERDWWSEMNGSEYEDENKEEKCYAYDDCLDPASWIFRRRMKEFADDRAKFAKCREHEKATGHRLATDLWHTSHSAVYDLKARTLILRVQEQDKVYSFKL